MQEGATVMNKTYLRGVFIEQVEHSGEGALDLGQVANIVI